MEVPKSAVQGSFGSLAGLILRGGFEGFERDELMVLRAEELRIKLFFLDIMISRG